MIYDYLDVYTFEYLMQQALSSVPDTMDKRQGSVIYDALAPACYRLAAFYIEIKNVYMNCSLETASGAYLDLKAAEVGKYRTGATYAVKKATFLNSVGSEMSVPLGSRFSTLSDSAPIYYTVTKLISLGVYELTCETAGASGNQYTGSLLAVTYIQGLATATMSDIITSAIDSESDAEFRARCLSAFVKSFGGNVSDYNDKLLAMQGIGDVQVYPAWSGGGTVKLSIIDESYRAVTQLFMDSVKEIIDPSAYTGKGVGTAPIGHSVTVTTPDEVTVNVSATIGLQSGYTLGQVQAGIEEAIEQYVSSLRQNWGIESPINTYAISMYLSRVTVSILSVTGVANVTNLQLNSSATDINFTETSATQQIPILGTVTLS